MTSNLERRRAWMWGSNVAALAAVVLWPAVSTAQSPTATAGPSTTAPCVAIVLPTVQGVDGRAGDVGSALRELLTSYLTGPSLKAVPLDARLESQAVEEARQKGCGNILTTTLSHKRSGGSMLGKAMGQAAGTAAWYVPGGASTAGIAARGAVIAGAQVVSSVAANTKAKDEMTLDYKFSSLDQANAAKPVTLKSKAHSDGEDILTPLAEKTAEAVASALGKK